MNLRVNAAMAKGILNLGKPLPQVVGTELTNRSPAKLLEGGPTTGYAAQRGAPARGAGIRVPCRSDQHVRRRRNELQRVIHRDGTDYSCPSTRDLSRYSQ